ncbi:MAG: Uncharacterised protein [Opitutia bacterium UBA7350]|nr:MAG: Uncharacterised protein [Opitutae bacterium UBA7350]
MLLLRKICLYLFSFLGYQVFSSKLCATEGPYVATPAIESSAYFEIVGMDRKSVYIIGQIGQASVKVCNRYSNILPKSFPQRVTVILDTSLANLPNQKSYQLTVKKGGFVELYIGWHEEIELNEICQAIMEALLIRAVYYRYGPSAVKDIPPWVVAGLSESLFIRFKPALMDAYALKLSDLSSKEVEAVFNATDKEMCDSIVALAVFAGIESIISNDEVFTQILDLSLKGVPIQERLISVFRASNPESADMLWWEQGVRSLCFRHRGAVDTMEASRLWLKELANMDAFVDRRSGATIRNLRELAQYGDDEQIREIIRGRRSKIMSGMLQVNPLYYNVAQSLGQFYEQILFEEPGFKRTTTLVNYLNDLNSAQLMQSLVVDALLDPKSRD